MRVRAAALAMAVAVVIGASLVGADVGMAAVAARPSSGSYCDAVAKEMAYMGRNKARRRALFDRIVARAPTMVRDIARDVRDLPSGSANAVKAHNLWTYFNNNNCCDCHGAKAPPLIADLTPDQRAKVEAGGQPD